MTEVTTDAGEAGGRVAAAALSATNRDPDPHLVGHGVGKLAELVFDGLAVPGIRAVGVQAGQ
ncbi:hypothetical protein [Streptomyces sp. 6N106]|uniref:hypothetical protein n=1 Tax=Streptomyces sp. 6N106 TaxID=3457418 RepID=UPI003FD459BB